MEVKRLYLSINVRPVTPHPTFYHKIDVFGSLPLLDDVLAPAKGFFIAYRLSK